VSLEDGQLHEPRSERLDGHRLGPDHRPVRPAAADRAEPGGEPELGRRPRLSPAASSGRSGPAAWSAWARSRSPSSSSAARPILSLPRTTAE